MSSSEVRVLTTGLPSKTPNPYDTEKHNIPANMNITVNALILRLRLCCLSLFLLFLASYADSVISPSPFSGALLQYNSEYNKIPASDDVDTKFSSTSQSNDVWYVAMFAVAVGKDTNYTPVYSNILYLGAVTIDKSMIN